MPRLYSTIGLRFLNPYEVMDNVFASRAAPSKRSAVSRLFKPGMPYSPAVEVPYVLGGQTAGLGALGELPLGIPGLKFSNDTAGRDFLNGYGGGGGCDDRGGTWTGVGNSLINAASQKFIALQTAADLNPAAQQRLDQWVAQAKNLIAQVDRGEQHDIKIDLLDPMRTLNYVTGGCGRSARQESAYKAALRALKAHVQFLASMSIPAAPPIDTTYDTTYDTSGGGGSNQGAMRTKDSASGIPTWAMVAGGVVVLGGLAFFGARALRK